MYINTPYKIVYDTQKYPFKEIVKEILEVDSLEKIHQLENYDLLSRDKDQSTAWHKAYYNKFEEKFYPLYVEFVKHLAEKFGYDSIIYQKIPTFRAHLVNNLGVGEWHKDKTYNHGVDELNFWMPFTDTYDTNTIWCESIEDLGDYRSYEVKYGEILVFSGANLMHGNKINTTEDTRVSVDFRLVDPEKFVTNDKQSINGITSFVVGGYFEKI
jgi:hypothetical protein